MNNANSHFEVTPVLPLRSALHLAAAANVGQLLARTRNSWQNIYLTLHKTSFTFKTILIHLQMCLCGISQSPAVVVSGRNIFNREEPIRPHHKMFTVHAATTKVFTCLSHTNIKQCFSVFNTAPSSCKMLVFEITN